MHYRLLNHLLTVVILVCSLNTLVALDSPLVIRSELGDLTAAINPNTGTIQLYRTGGGLKLTLVGSHFFLADIEDKANAFIPSDSVNWSHLRVGAKTAPVYYNRKDSIIFQLDSKDKKNQSTLVMDTEDEFWAEIPEFDGIVAAALGPTYLFLCVPSTHTLLAYKITNGSKIELAAIRNIGPDLMIQGTLNSEPTVDRILDLLPPEAQEQHMESLKLTAENIENGEIPPLKDPEPWIHILQGDKIVLVEPANQKIMVYEMRQKVLDLKSARSMEIELLVPPGFSVNSDPSPRLQYKKYAKMMRKNKITPYTMKELTALANVSANHSKKSSDGDIQASVDELYNLVLDFTTVRKLILYRPDAGGAGIEMKSIRDYTMEIATALHVDKINKRNKAAGLLKIAQKNLTKKKAPIAMRYLKRALSYNPALYEDVERNRKIVRRLSEEPDWTEMIEGARKAHERELAAIKKREEMLLEQEKQGR